MTICFKQDDEAIQASAEAQVAHLRTGPREKIFHGRKKKKTQHFTGEISHVCTTHFHLQQRSPTSHSFG